MTRKRKSRNPGRAPVVASKEDKKKLDATSDKKPKKLKGKKPGSRQVEGKKQTSKSSTASANQDPRIGSKKPIVLTKNPSAKAPVTKKASTKSPAIAPIKVIDNNKALEQELYAIEDDSQLQEIIDKQEQEIALSHEEVDYFNEKMERHQQLRELLGWDDDEDDDDQPNQVSDEDALWDKLDNNHLADYE